MAPDNEITAEDFKKYELAGFASFALDPKSQVKDGASMAYAAMFKLYTELGLVDDPIVNNAFATGAKGLASGQITSEGLYKAIVEFTNRYDAAAQKAKASEILERSGYKPPEEAKPSLNRHGGKTIETLINEAKNNEDAKKALTVIMDSEAYKFRAHFISEVLQDSLSNKHKALYSQNNQ